MSYINYFAKTDFRNDNRIFGIKREDRRYHMYIIGKTGMGKTTLLSTMIMNDIYHGEGLCFIDPHGDAVENIMKHIPESRKNDVIYFNPVDKENQPLINLLENKDPENRHLVVSSVISVFKKTFQEHWAHRQEHILRNIILALLDYPEKTTLVDAHRMLVDWRYRKEVVSHIKSPIVLSFWKHEFSRYLYNFKGEALSPIQNKLGAFLSTPLVRNIIDKSVGIIDFREILDNQKIMLVNLSKGRIGEDNASFLGSIIVTKLQLASLSRIDIPEHKRKDFYLFIDEFQTFIPTTQQSFSELLSESRKYHLCLILAHQYLGQLGEDLQKEDKMRKAIFGNIGTIIVFKVGIDDAKFLEQEFFPEFKKEDLINLDKYKIYLKMIIDGKISRAFSAHTLPLKIYKDEKKKALQAFN